MWERWNKLKQTLFEMPVGQLHGDVEVPEPPVQSRPRGRIDDDLRTLEFERAHRVGRVFVKAD